MVSLLHAQDGGTLYGMPYGQLVRMPQPYLHDGEHTGVTALSGTLAMWGLAAEMRSGHHPIQPLPPPLLGARSHVALCMRAARVLVDTLETHGSAAGGSGAGGAAAAAAAGGTARQQQGHGSSSGSGRDMGSRAARGLETEGAAFQSSPRQCEHALKGILASAGSVMAGTAWEDGEGSGGGSGGGGGGAGGSGGGGGDGARDRGSVEEPGPGRGGVASGGNPSDSGHGGSGHGGSGSSSSGSCSSGSCGGGRTSTPAAMALEQKNARRATWLRRGAFARRWWPLLVRCLHSLLDGVTGGRGMADLDPALPTLSWLCVLQEGG